MLCFCMIPAVSKSAGVEVSVCAAYWETAMVSAALPSHGAFPLPSAIQRAVRLWHGYTVPDYSLNTLHTNKVTYKSVCNQDLNIFTC